ncbi:d-amino acid dehydrogenase small subunit [Fusarium subglutinans]|uniref:D-amino acid dehydrogenase small subunit n=1 Tax=Gibberella subglutinans TaxID=42677 RepID=A0A8H5UZR5_GIBSU|nr:d-amino acid dehydrogenase small subunit [Fusarium subglutinans]KAF5603124.1 d-amino acid dehydrogenase small subunit [Fusarium subglutinans]
MDLKSAPIIVIGGGIVGASIAWHLAKEKKDVILITETIGGVATPKSFCWLNAAGATQKFYYDFRRRSMARWAEMGKELPDLPIHWGGVLACDRSPEERQEFYERQRRWGTSIRRMEAAELAALESQVDEAQFSLIKWGLHVPEEGTLEAQAAAAKLIAHAQSLGTRVHETKVTGFLKDDKGRVSGVVTDSEDVHASHVVLAAGLGSVPLLATENIRLPLNGQEGLLVNTAPSEKRYLNTLFRLPGLHMRQTLDGRIVFGASFAGGQPGDDPQATAKHLFSQVQKAFKNGDELEFSHYTIGVRPEPDDGYPILGSSGVEGLDLAVMHSGVTNAALVSELLAKNIVFGVEDPMLGDYRLDRFKNDAKL